MLLCECVVLFHWSEVIFCCLQCCLYAYLCSSFDGDQTGGGWCSYKTSVQILYLPEFYWWRRKHYVFSKSTDLLKSTSNQNGPYLFNAYESSYYEWFMVHVHILYKNATCSASDMTLQQMSWIHLAFQLLPSKQQTPFWYVSPTFHHHLSSWSSLGNLSDYSSQKLSCLFLKIVSTAVVS